MAKRQQTKQITQLDPDNDDDEGSPPQDGFVKADDSILKQRRIVKARRRGGAPAEPDQVPDVSPASEDTLTTQTWDFKAVVGSDFSFGGTASPAPFSFDNVTGTGGFGGFGAPAAAGDSAPSGFAGFGASATGFSGFGGGFGAAAATPFNFTGGAFGSAPSTDAKGDGDGDGDGEGDDDPEAEVGFTPMVKPLVTVTEVKDLTTGEEGERHAFPPTRSKLFHWKDNEWKETGIGKVSINVSTSDPKQARILFRAEQVGTIRLNSKIFASMKVEKLSDKGVVVYALADGKPGRFFIKFGKAAEAATLHDELSSLVNSLNDSTPAAAAKKNPPVPAEQPKQPVAVDNKPAIAMPVPQKPSVLEKKRTSPKAPAPKRETAASLESDAPAKKSKGEEVVAVAVLAGPSEAVGGVATVTQTEGGPALLELSIDGLAQGVEYDVMVSGAKVGSVRGRGKEQAVLSLNEASVSLFGAFSALGKTVSVVGAGATMATGELVTDSPLLQ